MERIFESPYTERDFVQFGKTKSVLNKRAQRLALLFNPPSVLSLVIMPKKELSRTFLYTSNSMRHIFSIIRDN